MILLLYAVTICVGSFLVFLLQPMVGKAILPLYGGTPAIWNTCMLFFQAVLLAGYAYAHFATSKLKLSQQAAIHLCLLLTAFLVLPISIRADAVPPSSISPPLFLLFTLLPAVGLPFFLVSSTAPMLQKWFMGTGHPQAKDPYFLYAASNIGSLTALIAYPLLFEPLMALSMQSHSWVLVYGLFILLMASCAWLLWRGTRAGLSGQEIDLKKPASNPPRLRRRLYWLLAAFVPSSLMLGATAHITTSVAVMPLFWVLPLALYLLTFIITFSRKSLLPHTWMTRLMPMVVLPFGAMIFVKIEHLEWFVVPIHLLLFFVVAMVCHGELVRTRPSGDYLTEFYFWMAAGGVMGGLFNAIVAPFVFNRVLEYPLVLVVACLLLPVRRHWKIGRKWLDIALPGALLSLVGVTYLLLTGFDLGGSRLALILLFGLPAVLAFCLNERPVAFALSLFVVLLAVGSFAEFRGGQVLYVSRNFFGVKRVMVDRQGAMHTLTHGATVHGSQFIDPEKRKDPTSYYHRSGPVGDLFVALLEREKEKRVAVIGLGAGAVASYAQPDLQLTFYEIDPQVEMIARDARFFEYLALPESRCKVVIGDGRLGIQQAEAGSFDMILLDAFSSGTIPVHLLTKEAVQTYLSKLAPGGFLAFHISNHFLNLTPALSSIASELGLRILEREDRHAFYGKEAAHYAVMFPPTSHPKFLEQHPVWKQISPEQTAQVWTDEYSNLTSLVKW
jgi:hypothetical protein